MKKLKFYYSQFLKLPLFSMFLIICSLVMILTAAVAVVGFLAFLALADPIIFAVMMVVGFGGLGMYTLIEFLDDTNWYE